MNVKSLVINLITIILNSLSPELLKKAADSILDIIENAVEKSPNKLDDVIVLPLCKKVREAFCLQEDENGEVK